MARTKKIKNDTSTKKVKNETNSENVEVVIKEAEIEAENKTETTKRTRNRSNNLNMNRPIYLYDFNGTLVGRFRGPTEAAKKLLGNNNTTPEMQDSHKIASLRSELSLYARNNVHSRSGVVFVQGYVPSYEELTPDEIVNNRKIQNTRGNKVMQYDFNGNLMHIFENANDAAEKLGKSTAWVSILCNANFILRYDR